MLLAKSLFFAAVMGSFAALAAARVIHVPGEAPTVQAGLDSLQDGDTVLVAVGVYAEALTAPPLHFVLRGDIQVDTGDYPRPLIDPSLLPGSDSLACLVLPLNSHPVIEHFRFRNGTEMFPRHSAGSYGGIVSRAPDVRMYSCLVDSAFVGFAQVLEGGVTTLERCQFRNDTVACLGGTGTVWHAQNCYFSARAFYVVAVAAPNSSFIHCHFGETHSVGGYLLHASGDGTLIEGCIFGPDSSSYSVLSVSYGSARVINNLFADCRSASGVIKIDVTLGDTVTLENNALIRLADDFSQMFSGLYLHWAGSFGSGRFIKVRSNVFADITGYAYRAKAIYSIGVSGMIEDNRFNNLDHDSLPAVRMIQADDDSLILRENLFWNTQLAVRGNAFTDARWNWWGDSTGPYHATQNPDGLGDEVQGDVQFEPWYPDTSFLSLRGIRTLLPERFEVEAYPNPFNSSVTLKLTPSERVIVRVELFDMLGRKVQDIWSGPLAFEKRITFDGSQLASGIYFARVWQPIGNRPLALAKLVLMK